MSQKKTLKTKHQTNTIETYWPLVFGLFLLFVGGATDYTPWSSAIWFVLGGMVLGVFISRYIDVE